MSNRSLGSIWILCALTASGLLLSSSLVMLIQRWQGNFAFQAAALPSMAIAPSPSPTEPELGPRHQLNYREWVELLTQEAKAAAQNDPEHLTILLGDSISLWFPPDLLPSDRAWLNQGISGETSAGLLRRLEILDDTEPDVIFLMIGINDLIRGVREETIVANQLAIVRYLKRQHPKTQIVIQTILPHSAGNATWEGRDRLLQLPNSRIRQVNEQLKLIAKQEKVYYLDLYALFADTEGNLQLALSTDGLHLNNQGYWVWRTALEVYRSTALTQRKSE